LTSLNAAQVRLIEAAPLAEFSLTQPCFKPKLTDTAAKSVRERLLLHVGDCLLYALNHINTNSHMRFTPLPKAQFVNLKEGKMKLAWKMLLILGVTVILIACSERTDVEAAIKSRLRDPDSAKFKVVAVNGANNKACAVFTAKNSYGGYGDWTSFGLAKKSGRWEIEDERYPLDQCSTEMFALLDECDQLTREIQPRLPPDKRAVFTACSSNQYNDLELTRETVEALKRLKAAL
jgi:hypothetical protein